MSPQPLVIRTRPALRAYISVFCTVWIVILGVAVANHNLFAFVIPLAILLYGVATARRIFATRVVADADGLLVCSGRDPQLIAWDAVERFRVVGSEQPPYGPVIDAVLISGDVIRLPVSARSGVRRSTRAHVDEQAARLNEWVAPPAV